MWIFFLFLWRWFYLNRCNNVCIFWPVRKTTKEKENGVMWKENRQIKLNHIHSGNHGINNSKRINGRKQYMNGNNMQRRRRTTRNKCECNNNNNPWVSKTELFLESIWIHQRRLFPKTKQEKNPKNPLLNFYQRFWLNTHSFTRVKQNKTRKDKIRPNTIQTHVGTKQEKGWMIKTICWNFIIPYQWRKFATKAPKLLHCTMYFLFVVHSVDFVLFFTIVDKAIFPSIRKWAKNVHKECIVRVINSSSLKMISVWLMKKLKIC